MPGKITGVSFDGTHSYDDWGLKLKNVEINLPEAKTVYIDVPGMNGSLDLTEAQNGGIVYGMRTLEFTFDARNCSYAHWAGLVSRVANAVEGKERKIILDIDSAYYYTGRCHINTKKTNEVTAEITVDCNCYPFKMDVTSTDDPWKWNTFCFVDGIIRYVPSKKINAPSTWEKITVIGWPHNEILKIISDSNDLKVKYRNTVCNLFSGENIMYDFDLFEGENELLFQGSGTVTIVHKGGML